MIIWVGFILAALILAGVGMYFRYYENDKETSVNFFIGAIVALIIGFVGLVVVANESPSSDHPDEIPTPVGTPRNDT